MKSKWDIIMKSWVCSLDSVGICWATAMWQACAWCLCWLSCLLLQILHHFPPLHTPEIIPVTKALRNPWGNWPLLAGATPQALRNEMLGYQPANEPENSCHLNKNVVFHLRQRWGNYTLESFETCPQSHGFLRIRPGICFNQNYLFRFLLLTKMKNRDHIYPASFFFNFF